MSKYFSIGKAWKELTNSAGAGEKALAAAKLVGKSLSNAAVYGVTEALPKVAETAAKKNQERSSELLKRNDLTEEQRERFQEINQKSSDYLEKNNSK